VLLILINIGYTIPAGALVGDKSVVIWVVTSWYLAATALFFVALLGNNTEARLSALANGCLVAGVIASVAAIIGYARLFPSANDVLLLYERARGTFKDPNVLGAFLIGLVMEFSLRSTAVSPEMRIGLTIGFLGGFTTFSTFSYETFRLLEGAQLPQALANVLLSVTACLAFTFLGIVAARHL